MKTYNVMVIDKFTKFPFADYTVKAISKWHAKLIISKEICPKKNGFILVARKGGAE